MPPALTTDDRAAISDLMAKYAWAIDTADIDGYVACFGPDAVLTMRGVSHTGHEAIRTYVSSVVRRPDFAGRQHHHSELIFDGDGERCRVKCYSTISQRFPDGECKIMFSGWYRDIVVKLDGAWLFASRSWDVWDAAKLESYRD